MTSTGSRHPIVSRVGAPAVHVPDTGLAARRQTAALRIAVLAPPWFEVPPITYGGIEDVCHSLVEGLQERGHDVTLISAGGGGSPTRVTKTFPEPPKGLGGQDASLIEVLHAARAARALEALGPFDIVHDHSVAGPLTASGSTTTVVTAHGPVQGAAGDYFRALGRRISLVAISEAQRVNRPRLPWVGVVHNGIRVEEFPFSAVKDDYLLFLGRIHPDKAPHVAIDTAREVGIRIVMAAKCSEPREQEYFGREIEPRLGPGVEWIGEAGRDQKMALLRNARALIFPIAWDEPFGLVMIEAMACGTPVVALSRGAVPEVVVDGVTGFVRDHPGQLPDAVRAVSTIEPAACRRHVERRFAAVGMVDAYERLFSRLASSTRVVRAR